LKNEGATILAEWIESNPMLESLGVCCIQFSFFFNKKERMKTHTLLSLPFFSFYFNKRESNWKRRNEGDCFKA
jgi:hypothetical protein